MPYDYDYFISYAHADNKPEDGNPGFVDEFVRKLRNSEEHQKMFGERVSVFFDEDEIDSMSDWDNRIRSSLASSRFLIVLLSPSYFKSEYCAREFDWWMQHEMHRRILGEGTAPILIVSVNDLYNSNVNPIPDISPNLQKEFPNWVKQIRQIQSGLDFDMHNLERTKIDEILRALCENIKDKYFKQKIAEDSPINAGYPQYNENFVGRRENLRSLRQTLSTRSTTAISAVNGLGGIGKTELALTYGHAFAWDYGLGRVFVTCENMEFLEDVILSSSIAEMHDLKLEGTNEQKLTTLYNALKRKIKLIEQRNEEKNIDRTLGTHILLILDNVNRLELISQRNLDKLPKFFHVIITTRESANDFPYIHTESVDRLSEDESVELLSNLRPFGSDEKEVLAAREIAKLLDGFTLAVELTGAYLSRSPRVTYQKQYDRLKANISNTMETMADKTQKLRGHQAECISAVLESTLSELSDNARKALDFAALMSPDAVGLVWLPELLGLDEDEGFEVLDELTGYNLLTPLGGELNIARIHRLVAEAVKKDIPADVQKEIIAKIRDKCEALLHKDDKFWCTPEHSWNIKPVSEFYLMLSEQWTVEDSEAEIDWNLTEMLCISEYIHTILGKMSEARNVCHRDFDINNERVKAYPSNFKLLQKLSSSYYRYGSIEIAAGNIDGARNNFNKSLEIRKHLVDKMPENGYYQLMLCVVYNHFAELERSIGNSEAAREYCKKSLEIYMQQVNKMPDNIKILCFSNISFNQLIEIEKTAGNTEIALDYCKKVLDFQELLADKYPEDEDIQWLLSLTNFQRALLETGAGNIEVARAFYMNALEIAKKLADKQPEFIGYQLYLIGLYIQLVTFENTVGNSEIARNYCKKILEIQKWLKDKKPEVIFTKNSLGLSNNLLAEFENIARNSEISQYYCKNALERHKWLSDRQLDDLV